ncbi:MAG: aconitase X catalytic domain-containing protein [Archaeoglobaceae archaeon]|nr:aconitase X catalytic domain-containing protein [Archaeoglobaceae archaeon]MCX8151895.1 aconitase X catalytic domain-containing protein [Archaeoglobaceae archaeon]MDW8013284.1 aconitase X catalytic domain-containing protein [Archaeoglobaceae archaeon]
MYLSKDEEEMLERGDDVAKAMQILVTIGKMFEAERLIKIRSAHVSGISYDNIGDAGLEFLESLKAKFSVPTTINPAGFDLLRWKEMRIDDEFYNKQIRILKALKDLGANLTLTCTPYYVNRPNFGDHLAWAESSAVVYANSLIGARTNREAGITSIAAAITGRTAYFGLHIKENRAPTVKVKVSGNLALAGYILGKELKGNEIPYVIFEKKPLEFELKLFSASLATSSGIAMFHSPEITPEAEDFEVPREKIEVEGKGEKSCDADLIAIGCPHTSREELKTILELLNGEKVKKNFWIFTSRKIFEESKDLVEKLEKLGVKVFCDTCMVVSPATDKFNCLMVNSAKALHYIPLRRKCHVSFSSLEDCVRYAKSP